VLQEFFFDGRIAKFVQRRAHRRGYTRFILTVDSTADVDQYADDRISARAWVSNELGGRIFNHSQYPLRDVVDGRYVKTRFGAALGVKGRET
jgi:hypothetical protein